MNARCAEVRAFWGTDGSCSKTTSNSSMSAAAASRSSTTNPMWSTARPTVVAGTPRSCWDTSSQTSPNCRPSIRPRRLAGSPPSTSRYQARVASGFSALRWTWWKPSVSSSSTISIRVPHGSKMNPILNRPGMSRRVDPSGNRCSRTPEPRTPTASSSPILAARSGYEKLMWLTPVPWVLPSVGCTTNVSSTPPQSAASGRSATGSQSRYRLYQRTPSVGLEAVMWTWW